MHTNMAIKWFFEIKLNATMIWWSNATMWIRKIEKKQKKCTKYVSRYVTFDPFTSTVNFRLLSQANKKTTVEYISSQSFVMEVCETPNIYGDHLYGWLSWFVLVCFVLFCLLFSFYRLLSNIFFLPTILKPTTWMQSSSE